MVDNMPQEFQTSGKISDMIQVNSLQRNLRVYMFKSLALVFLNKNREHREFIGKGVYLNMSGLYSHHVIPAVCAEEKKSVHIVSLSNRI